MNKTPDGLVTDNYVFFWPGIFSQWHQSKFIVGDRCYNTAEQYMMHQKAMLFGDQDIAAQILQKFFQKNNNSLVEWSKILMSIVGIVSPET